MNPRFSSPMSSTILLLLISTLFAVVDARRGGRGRVGGLVHFIKEYKEQERKANIITASVFGGTGAIFLILFVRHLYINRQATKRDALRQQSYSGGGFYPTRAGSYSPYPPSTTAAESLNTHQDSPCWTDRILNMLRTKREESGDVLPTTTTWLPESESGKRVGLLLPSDGLSRMSSTSTFSSTTLAGSTVYSSSGVDGSIEKELPPIPVEPPLPQAPAPVGAGPFQYFPL